MSKKSDFLSTLKSVANNVHLGNKSATDVADSVNAWLKEGGGAIKVKIEDEVERSVSKMGFIKRGEFEALKQEVAAMKIATSKKRAKATAPKKQTVKTNDKKSTKKAATKDKATSIKKAAK